MYKVTTVREINYMSMSEDERKEIWRLDDLRLQQITTSFHDEDEYFALYEDLDNRTDYATNDATYAVYMGKSKELLCLLVDAGVALNGCDDYDYYCERANLYKRIALAAGWPEKMDCHTKERFTVRLKRIVDVEVYAADQDEAKAIGEKLVSHQTEPSIGTTLEGAWRANSNGEYDYVDFAIPAQPENDGVWDLSLSAKECEQILKED